MVSLPTLFDAGAIAPRVTLDVSTDGAPLSDRLAAHRFRHVPEAMRAGRWWMVARDKAPYRVLRDGTARVTVAGPSDIHDAANHCTFDDALAAIDSDPALNLMLALGMGNDLVCVDLDPLAKVAPEYLDAATAYQRELKLRLNHTYSEVSLSGRGMHFIGRAPDFAPEGKASAKHERYKVDFLFRGGLVVTGDHREGTAEVADITLPLRAILGSMADASTGAALPVDTNITPATCDEKRLVSILTSGNYRHGEAFRTGRNLHGDWSSVRTAIMNTAAEFCTDEQLVHRVISRSGFVQLAEDKDRETRLEKFNRQWVTEWQKALRVTEPTRRARAAAHVETKPLSLADLWAQNTYVQYMVQERAKHMITEGLVSGSSAPDLAPLFRYLEPENLNQLEDDLRRTKNEAFARICMEARLILQDDADCEVQELNDYLNKVILEEAEINQANRFRQYNRQYYIVENYGGAARVFRDEFHPETGGQISWSIQKFCEAKANDKILTGWDLDANAPKIMRAPNVWTVSGSARRYVAQEARFETTAREIETETGNILNLFQGWATTPVAGPWDAIRYLIHDILCAGSHEASDYLLNYLAQMIQRPHMLPGTAVILQSEEQGTGKSTFMALLRQLLGARYCSVTSDASTLVGQFNAQAMNKILLHFEEAVAPNDRAVESKVKALITNETLTYNPKGIAAIEARNYARVFMTSNAQQVAHLARHDRRMFVLSVSPKHANDAAFWSEAHRAFPQEMEAFMHALWMRDISAFRPGVIPHTEAKDKQKMASVVGPDRALFEFLEAGRLPAFSHFDGRYWEVRVSALTDYFLKYQSRIGNRIPQPSRVLEPIRLAPAYQRRLTVCGQASKPYWLVALPTLPEARRAFLAHQNVASYDWGDAGGDWALD